ncbi:glycosyltransferase family 4 protein (plasmid) [Haloferax sp. S1W]|uniref:glycosyltransferase family 4 protein n=1 Tax=Haloferax sp. S1W TaxID=3377110 RepID=UPI0037C863F9
MDSISVLIVGPADRKSGGIARYISAQLRQLDDHLSLDLYSTTTASTDSPLGFLRGTLDTLAGWIRFPFRARPDVVHVHTSHYFSFYLSSFYVLYSAYVWNRPVILHVHGSSFDEFVQDATGPLAWFQSVVFDAAAAVVVLSDYWKQVLSVRVAPEKLVVIPNAVATDEYDSHELGETQHLVFVSNHVERKGIVEATEAIARLYDEGVQFKTTIAGTGPLSHHAERLAADYDSVEYVGYISEDEKRALLSEGSVYLLPTHAEGLPIAILEAMAGGNTIVSTTVGSIPSVVDAKNGVLVPPGDVDALTSALETVLTDSESTRRMGDASRSRVEAEYSWATVTDDLISLYRRVLNVSDMRTRPKSTLAVEE